MGVDGVGDRTRNILLAWQAAWSSTHRHCRLPKMTPPIIGQGRRFVNPFGTILPSL
jgi:hypothetical protein